MMMLKNKKKLKKNLISLNHGFGLLPKLIIKCLKILLICKNNCLIYPKILVKMMKIILKKNKFNWKYCNRINFNNKMK